MENNESNSSSLLLEIGTEEIPARFLPDAIIRLKESAGKIFSDFRLSFSSLNTYATPRRLSLIADVEASQKASEKEVWGPPVNVAFDKEGNPTKAAEAFVKNNGIQMTDLLKKEKGKGIYLFAVVKEGAQNTEDILPEILPKLISSLSFPKSMRWGNGSMTFARPIHWICALYGNEKVNFELDGIKSSNLSRGHRFLSPGLFEVKDTKTYINLMRNNFVVLDTDERKNMILSGSNKLTLSVNASLIEDEELIQHVTFLVEYPLPVLGTFSPEYLALPEELLITVMKGHQKYFALKDGKGRLTNYFIVISNTKQDNIETVKTGAEKVIRARFEDAKFYYEEDKKTRLKEGLEGLKKVIYHDRLGSLYDKTQRIALIADYIGNKCCPKKISEIKEAAILAKTDLISGVVGEFPELQGIMGGYYALNEGYSREISKALSEQYLPAHSGDRLPETDSGAILSLSDKFDNMASFFMIGLSPTGTEDPFALRRQALGAIAILTEKKYAITISEILDVALNAFDIENRQDVLNDIAKFFEQRLDPLFVLKGYSPDCIASVMNYAKNNPIYALKERLEAVQRFKEDPDYDSFILAIKRINNIAPKYDVPSVNQGLFSDEEMLLHKEFESVSDKINSLMSLNKYSEALELIKTLKEPINRFFDKVLIMDKREDIKLNRLSLIRQIQILAQQIADFSKLT